MADGILEIDHLDAAVGPSEEKALVAKCAFELVTKLLVTHDHASWGKAIVRGQQIALDRDKVRAAIRTLPAE
jgi:hypothetical protein